MSLSLAEENLDEQTQQDYYCMAQNLHHEARGESITGLIAVANVVMNRVSHSAFPDTICDVIYQKNQFSWVGRQKTKKIEKIDPKIREIAYKVAVNKSLEDTTDGALFFKVKQSSTSWQYGRLFRTKVIGNHEFFKYKKDLNAKTRKNNELRRGRD